MGAEVGTVDVEAMTEVGTEAGRPILGEALHMEVEEVMGEATKAVEVMGAATKAHIFHVDVVEVGDAAMEDTAGVVGEEIHIRANTELAMEVETVIGFHPTARDKTKEQCRTLIKQI